MSSRLPLSPTQATAFSLGRTLILYNVWHDSFQIPLDMDRALLLDYAGQFPRTVANMVPELKVAIVAHSLDKHDLSDAFASITFSSMRERFSCVVSELVARDLVREVNDSTGSGNLSHAITEIGTNMALVYTSALSKAYKAVYTTLSAHWHRKKLQELVRDIRAAIPDESRLANDLREPMAVWLAEEGHG